VRLPGPKPGALAKLSYIPLQVRPTARSLGSRDEAVNRSRTLLRNIPSNAVQIVSRAQKGRWSAKWIVNRIGSSWYELGVSGRMPRRDSLRHMQSSRSHVPNAGSGFFEPAPISAESFRGHCHCAPAEGSALLSSIRATLWSVIAQPKSGSVQGKLRIVEVGRIREYDTDRTFGNP
jgi:hypothetical protein